MLRMQKTFVVGGEGGLQNRNRECLVGDSSQPPPSKLRGAWNADFLAFSCLVSLVEVLSRLSPSDPGRHDEGCCHNLPTYPTTIHWC